MASLNKVFLMGRLTHDPEHRYIPNGTAVTTFSIAVNRVYIQQGEKKEEVLYIKVVTWAKMAETCSEYLLKGSPVLVEGRLQSRGWETPQGEKRTTIEVVADRVQFLERAKGSKQEPGAAAPDAEAPDAQPGGSQGEDAPF